MPNPKPKRRLLAAGGALLAALVLGEAALRAGEFLQGFRAETRAILPGETILVVGDSHALASRPGESYPELLAGMLGHRGNSPLVANVSEKDLNSAEVLERLPAWLREKKPALI